MAFHVLQFYHPFTLDANPGLGFGFSRCLACWMVLVLSVENLFSLTENAKIKQFIAVRYYLCVCVCVFVSLHRLL